MFRQLALAASSKVLITLYCEGDFEDCVRKKMRDKGVIAPDTLLPDGGHLQARKLVAD